MSMSGALALPWQTFYTGQTPDTRALIAAGAPVAQRVVATTLRRPALALLVTTLLDATVAVLTGRPGAMWMIGLRVGMGLVTAVLGMAAGAKLGKMRQLTGIASTATGFVQIGSVLMTAFSGVVSPLRLLGLVPSIVAQLSSLVLLVKTAAVSLKRSDASQRARSEVA
jgi:hypothetical protein